MYCNLSKAVPLSRAGANWAKKYSSYLFLTSALDRSGQRHAPATFNPGTHWIAGWVDPRAGLDTGLAEISFASEGKRTPAVQPAVRRYTELPQLRRM
jgi:hypothetical protein